MTVTSASRSSSLGAAIDLSRGPGRASRLAVRARRSRSSARRGMNNGERAANVCPCAWSGCPRRGRGDGHRPAARGTEPVTVILHRMLAGANPVQGAIALSHRWQGSGSCNGRTRSGTNDNRVHDASPLARQDTASIATATRPSDGSSSARCAAPPPRVRPTVMRTRVSLSTVCGASRSPAARLSSAGRLKLLEDDDVGALAADPSDRVATDYTTKWVGTNARRTLRPLLHPA
jgi:hypothetical protein